MSDNPFQSPKIQDKLITFADSASYFDEFLRSQAEKNNYKFSYNFFQSLLFSIKKYTLILNPTIKLEINYRKTDENDKTIKTHILLVCQKPYAYKNLFFTLPKEENNFLKEFEKLKKEILTQIIKFSKEE